jgi:hypothetical protein
MPLSLRRAHVDAILERHPGLVRLEVDGAPCIAYPALTGEVELGDEVLVNVQARELGLGSGGFDVLYANLTRGLELPPAAGAHVMALPYTPLQHAAPYVEERTGEVPPVLDGLPVALCTLHSQLLPVLAGLGTGLRVAYVQLAGGALPVDLSDAVRVARERFGVVAVAVAPCFGGDHAAVNAAYALAWAAAEPFDAVVCSVGPGIVGTGVSLGHGAVELAAVANLATALGGAPVLMPRLSERDARDRHRGVSHHTRAVVELSSPDLRVAWPRGLDTPPWLDAVSAVDADGWRAACAGLPLETMGRDADAEPGFFAAAFAGGRMVGELARARAGAQASADSG